jgi:hypothetical protein
MVDNISKELYDGNILIVNTDVSIGGQGGIHYITLFLKNKTCYIVDSLGKDNYRPYDDIMFKQIREKGFRIKFYNGAFQLQDDVNCGKFAIDVCNLINENKKKSFSEIDEIIKNKFGGKPSVKGIKEIIKDFGIHKE